MKTLTSIVHYLIISLLIATLYFAPNTLALSDMSTSLPEIYAPLTLPKELQKRYTKSRPLRVLCLDGGGVRGVIPARILSEIEQRTNKPISELFDLIVGNSTGGIIALGLTVPDEKNQPKHSADDILKLYMNSTPKIFEKSLVRKIMTGGGLWDAQYDRKNIDQILKELFGDMKLSQTLKPVLVLSYIIDTAQTHLWVSKADKKGQDYFVRDIAGATSAAPTYFAPKKMVDSTGNITYEADGGIYANNPSTVVIAEVFRSIPDMPRDGIMIVSIGTGQVQFSEKATSLENAGIIGWVVKANLIDVMMNASNSLFEWQTSILNDASKRIQITLPHNLGEMDDASDEHLNALLGITEEYIKTNSQMLDELSKALSRDAAQSG